MYTIQMTAKLLEEFYKHNVKYVWKSDVHMQLNPY